MRITIIIRREGKEMGRRVREEGRGCGKPAAASHPPTHPASPQPLPPLFTRRHHHSDRDNHHSADSHSREGERRQAELERRSVSAAGKAAASPAAVGETRVRESGFRSSSGQSRGHFPCPLTAFTHSERTLQRRKIVRDSLFLSIHALYSHACVSLLLKYLLTICLLFLSSERKKRSRE